MRVSRSFNITLARKAKYLGVVLDSKKNFFDHIELVCARADAIVGVTRRLLPNVNGPYNACRMLYYQV